MAEFVNLRRKRKSRQRAEEDVRAAENRARHGATKTERRRRDAETEKAAREHAGRRLGRGDE